MAIDCVLSIVMPTNTTKGHHCTLGWDGPLSDNALPHTLLALPHHCRSSLLQLSNSNEKCILSFIRSHLRPGCRACSFCHHVGSFPPGEPTGFAGWPKIVFLKSIFSEKSNAHRTFSEIQDHWDECWADNKSHGDCVYIVRYKVHQSWFKPRSYRNEYL